MKELGKRVRAARQINKMSAKDLAEAIGITADEVYNIEYARLKKPPKSPTLRSIADACKVNPEWLIDGEGEMKAPITREREIMEFAAQVVKESDTSIKKRLITALANLDADQWDTLENFIDEMIKGR